MESEANAVSIGRVVVVGIAIVVDVAEVGGIFNKLNPCNNDGSGASKSITVMFEFIPICIRAVVFTTITTFAL
jgi:hypothetical protein